MVKRLVLLLCLLVTLPIIAQERGPWALIGRTPNAGAYCSNTVSPTSESFSTSSGTATLTVTAGAGCAWTAVSSDTGFLTVTSGSSGTGNGSVAIAVTTNTGVGRTATLTVAGLTISVVQSGTPTGCVGATSAAVVCNGFGYGMDTRAAYGCGSNPTIYRVNTLTDNTADTTNGDGTHSGSFRTALQASGPRVVIFETSGMIDMASDIHITSPCLTVAGQTAPSPGITMRGAVAAASSAGGFFIRSHDMLFQHFRMRVGDGGPVIPQTSGHDGFDMYAAGGAGEASGIHDIVMDHMSISWAAGKQVDMYQVANNTKFTMWKSIISEALFRAKNITSDWAGGVVTSLAFAIGDSGAAPVSTGTNYQVTMYGNLFAHNSERNPEVGSGDTVQFINNVVDDFGKDPNGSTGYGTLLYTPDGSNPWLMDLIGNNYITGPGTGPFATYRAIWVFSGLSGSHFYATDNSIDTTANPGSLLVNDSGISASGSATQSTTGYTILAASATKAAVLAWAGARPLDRDTVDSRIITEVTNHTATNGASCPGLTYTNAAVSSIPGRICSQTDVGGWPILAANTRALTLPASPHTATASGYTNLEVWLHGYATALEP